jgi:single-stranded DNA-binding protein
VSVEGRSRTRKYQGNDGIDRYITEVNADKLDFDSAETGHNTSDRGEHSSDTGHLGNGDTG